MGIIKAIGQAFKGGLGDQWLEVIEPDNMGDQTVFCRGIKTRNGQNNPANKKYNTNFIHLNLFNKGRFYG